MSPGKGHAQTCPERWAQLFRCAKLDFFKNTGRSIRPSSLTGRESKDLPPFLLLSAMIDLIDIVIGFSAVQGDAYDEALHITRSLVLFRTCRTLHGC